MLLSACAKLILVQFVPGVIVSPAAMPDVAIYSSFPTMKNFPMEMPASAIQSASGWVRRSIYVFVSAVYVEHPHEKVFRGRGDTHPGGGRRVSVPYNSFTLR